MEGLAEVSGGSLSLTGHVDAIAPLGKTGTLLLDPLDLYISNTQPAGATVQITSGSTVTAGGSPDAMTSSWITPSVLTSQAANISLATSQDLFVSDPVTLTGAGQGLSLQAGRTLDIKASLTAPGILYLKADTAHRTTNPGSFIIDAAVSGGTVFLGSTSKLGITINKTVVSTGATPLITVACDCFINSNLSVILQAPGGMIEYGPATNGFNQTMLTHDESVFNAAVLRFGLSHDPILGTQALAGTLTLGSAAGPISLDKNSLDLNASGALIQPAGSFFTDVSTLTGSGGSASLNGGDNAISNLGPFTTTAGGFNLTAANPLTVTGALSIAGDLSVQGGGDVAVANPVTATGNIKFLAAHNLDIRTGGVLTTPGLV